MILRHIQQLYVIVTILGLAVVLLGIAVIVK